MRRSLWVLLLLLTPSVPATAETVITLDDESSATVSHETIYLAADGFRDETAHAVTIFRPEQNVLYDFTPARQRYTRVTPEKMRQASSDFDASRRDWGAKLNAMPEELRRRVEAAFGPATANSKSPLIFTATDLMATFDNWHCRMLHVMLEGVLHGSVCVVALADLGLDAGDEQVLRRLTEFMLQGPRPISGRESFWDLAAIEAAVGHPAFPVVTIIALPSGWFETTVRSVEKRAAPAGAFDLPEGLAEETMPPH